MGRVGLVFARRKELDDPDSSLRLKGLKHVEQLSKKNVGARDGMRATTFLIISSLHTPAVTPVLLLMDRKWRAVPSVSAFLRLSLSNGTILPIYVFFPYVMHTKLRV